jgi:hypothetical protein
MNWYLAKIVFQIICGDGKHTPQFDEQLRLVEANDEETAFSKAVSIGVSEQETFYNDRKQLVQWRFINVADLYQLNLIDEAELHSKISEVDRAEDYVNFVNKKAEQIKSKYSYNELQLL